MRVKVPAGDAGHTIERVLSQLRYGRAVELQLGGHAFDVTTRAVIMSSVWQGSSAVRDAISLVEQGAEIIHVVGVGDDLVELIESLGAELNVPVTFGNTASGALAQLAATQALRMFEPGTGPGAQGATVVAIMAGARLLATNDVRATRRTADTISELLQRRTSDLPAELTNAGAR